MIAHQETESGSSAPLASLLPLYPDNGKIPLFHIFLVTMLRGTAHCVYEYILVNVKGKKITKSKLFLYCLTYLIGKGNCLAFVQEFLYESHKRKFHSDSSLYIYYTKTNSADLWSNFLPLVLNPLYSIAALRHVLKSGYFFPKFPGGDVYANQMSANVAQGIFRNNSLYLPIYTIMVFFYQIYCAQQPLYCILTEVILVAIQGSTRTISIVDGLFMSMNNGELSVYFHGTLLCKQHSPLI